MSSITKGDLIKEIVDRLVEYDTLNVSNYANSDIQALDVEHHIRYVLNDYIVVKGEVVKW